jgi:hypothetical protein
MLILGIVDSGKLKNPYPIGSTGPGGGIVFYDAGSDLSWGRYMEAAPNTWYSGSADPNLAWSGNTNTSVSTSTALGTGTTNTNNIIAQNNTAPRAATSSRNYNGGSKTDWLLPSRVDLENLYAQRNVVGGFGGQFYWSSSQESAAIYAWFIDFSGQGAGGELKSESLGVRPIRYFVA